MKKVLLKLHGKTSSLKMVSLCLLENSTCIWMPFQLKIFLQHILIYTYCYTYLDLNTHIGTRIALMWILTRNTPLKDIYRIYIEYIYMSKYIDFSWKTRTSSHCGWPIVMSGMAASATSAAVRPVRPLQASAFVRSLHATMARSLNGRWKKSM